jgi:hypothetical protein
MDRTFEVSLVARPPTSPLSHTYSLKVLASTIDEAKSNAKAQLERIGLLNVQPYAVMHHADE